ncbi:MAG: glycosyltransferase family 39 protein [Anaerolineales bacterium]|nr:glycosyltransferase family 39 protein [Anaerolineales bacterium]
MAASTVPTARPALLPFSAAARLWWAAAALLLLAGALRVYHLGADPLWYDELISTQVVRRGLLSIFVNSQVDPHPPLYYLLLWLASGFGAAQAEWAWRWLSALAGALSVPALYLLARRTAGDLPALVVAMWLAVNPTAVYFSQEARWPAVTLLLALLLTLAFSALLAQPAERRRWAVYAALGAVGLFTSYSFLLVFALQLPLVLWAVRRQPRAAWLAGVLLALPLLQALLAANTLPAIAVQHAATRALNLKEIVQSLLAGDAFRYGNFWPHKVTVGLLGALAALGAWRAWRTGRGAQRVYAAAQVGGPLAAYGLVLSPFLNLNLPTYESRQFFALLPALYWLVAEGLALLWAALPRAAAVAAALALSTVVLVGSAQGLGRYWTITRSPEGQAMRFVAPQLRPGDALVAVDFFSAAALRYYLPDWPLYTQPRAAEAGLDFWRPEGQLHYRLSERTADVPLAEVYAYPRLWAFSVPGRLDEYAADIVRGCQVEAAADISWLPLRVQRLSHCVTPGAP